MGSDSQPRTGNFPCVAAAWQAHEGELRGYLRNRMGDADAADDVLQDVFVKAMGQGPGFCALNDRRAWLFQVARNTLVDRLRTTHPHEPLSDELAEVIPLDTQQTAPVDALTGCLLRSLGELPAEDAAILRACDLEGQTQRAFAQANGLSLPAAKARVLRARERLRKQMSQACQVQFEADGRVASHVPRPPPQGSGSIS